MVHLLCGAFCRFVGSRFVAAGEHHCVSQIGAHAASRAVMLHVHVSATEVSMGITLSSRVGDSIVYSHTTRLPDGRSSVCGDADQDVLFTVWVARWAAPRLARVSFIQAPHTGIRSIDHVTSFTIAAAAFSFSGLHTFEYNPSRHCAKSGDTTLTFLPGSVIIRCASRNYVDECRFGRGVVSCGNAMYIAYSTDAPRGVAVIDSTLVEVCRCLVISQSSR